MSGAQYETKPDIRTVAVQQPQAPARAPQEILRAQLVKMAPEFRNALPSHIAPEKFQRVVMTAVQQQPDLLSADRKSLLGSSMKCAADGLLPDGREAAFVIFNTKEKVDGVERWVKRVQYMPMLVGLQKRARNSGEIAGLTSQVVYEQDEFVQTPDDFEKPIRHRPPPLGTPRGKPIGAYSMAKLKDGTIVAEVMDSDQINRVRAVSKSKDGPAWTQWWDEMARKTVFKRLSKWLPMDAETDDMIRRDDESEAAPMVHAGPTLDAEPVTETPGGKMDALEQIADDAFPGDAQ